MRPAAACAAVWLLACAAPGPPAPATIAPTPTAVPAPAAPTAPAAEAAPPPETTAEPAREMPAQAREQIYVTALPIGQGHVRIWTNGSDPIDVRDDGSDAPALEAVARAARAKVAPDARVVCAFDKSLSYGAAVGIIDAFKKVGFTRISLAVRPSAGK